MLRYGVVVATVLGVSCADTSTGTPGFRPLNRTALRASQPRTIVATRRPTPDLVLRSHAGKGLLGYAIANSFTKEHWEEIQRGGPLQDPAVKIGEALSDQLAKRFSLKVLVSIDPPTDASSPSELIAAYPDVDLILDVTTTVWGTKDFGNYNYGVAYDGTVTLIDARSRKVIAEGICASHP